MTSVEHDQIKQSTDGECSPDPEVIVHFNLSNWHPLKIGADRIHFALVEGDFFSAELNIVLDERSLSVVLVGHTVTVGIVGNLMIVPYLLGWLAILYSLKKLVETYRNPCVGAEGLNGIEICSVLSMSPAIVI
jgi:hypothetical protein